MIPPEVIQKIRRIQIRTSHVVDELLAGQWHSAFKGRGIEFEEVRPYAVGDDVRSIDWNVTARTGEPYIKLFREERELSVQLLVDLSGSNDFGTNWQTKRDLITEIGATLAFSAIKNNDKVGITIFTNQIELALPPQKGTRHVLRLIRELLYCEPVGRGTRIQAALEHLNRSSSRKVVVFLISDFQDEGFEKTLKITRRKHDIIPIVVEDRREREIPKVGLLRLHDSETGSSRLLDTVSRRQRRDYQAIREQQARQRDALFRRLNMRPIRLLTGEDFTYPLQQYFHQRERRR